MMDNLERTDWILARNVLDLVQPYYTEERLVNITHDDPLREPETIVVNEYNPETGAITNDLTVGEYDIVITSTPARATLEDSQFEQARALREIGVQIPDSVLIENSRLMRKAEIVKQMQGDQESPEAQQAKQLEMRMREAEVMAAEAEAQKKMADTQLSAARAQEISGQNQGGQQEVAQAQQEIELERWKIEQEFALKREQMEREFQIKQAQLAQELQLEQQKAAQEQQLREREQQVKEEQMRQQALQQRVQAARQQQQRSNTPNPNPNPNPNPTSYQPQE
jgi:hypothetical protein